MSVPKYFLNLYIPCHVHRTQFVSQGYWPQARVQTLTLVANGPLEQICELGFHPVVSGSSSRGNYMKG